MAIVVLLVAGVFRVAPAFGVTACTSATACSIVAGVHRNCTCGQKLTANYTLDANLDCPAGTPFALIVCASNVTVSGKAGVFTLQGHSTASQPGYGIQIGDDSTPVSSARIRNLEIAGFTDGIRLENAFSAGLAQLWIHANRHYGIDVGAADDTRISVDESPVWKTAPAMAFPPFSRLVTYAVVPNLIHNNGDEGIHAGAGSLRTTIRDSAVFQNVTENVYLQKSDQPMVMKTCTWGAGGDELKIDGTKKALIKSSVFQGQVLVTGASDGVTFKSNRRRAGFDILGGLLKIQTKHIDSGDDNPPKNVHALNLEIRGNQDGCVAIEREDADNGLVLPFGNKIKKSCLSNCTGGGEAIREIKIDKVSTLGKNTMCRNLKGRVGGNNVPSVECCAVGTSGSQCPSVGPPGCCELTTLSGCANDFPTNCPTQPEACCARWWK